MSQERIRAFNFMKNAAAQLRPVFALMDEFKDWAQFDEAMKRAKADTEAMLAAASAARDKAAAMLEQEFKDQRAAHDLAIRIEQSQIARQLQITAGDAKTALDNAMAEAARIVEAARTQADEEVNRKEEAARANEALNVELKYGEDRLKAIAEEFAATTAKHTALKEAVESLKSRFG